MRRATTLAFILVAALLACDGRVAGPSHSKARLSFELEWSHQRRGEQTRWEIRCAGDEWVHVKAHYKAAANGEMEGVFFVTPAYLQAIRREADKQRFFELRGPLRPSVVDDSQPMTLIELTLSIDGETLRMHLRDPRDAMRPEDYRRFQAVFDSIVGSLPAGPHLEH